MKFILLLSLFIASTHAVVLSEVKRGSTLIVTKDISSTINEFDIQIFSLNDKKTATLKLGTTNPQNSKMTIHKSAKFIVNSNFLYRDCHIITLASANPLLNSMHPSMEICGEDVGNSIVFTPSEMTDLSIE